MDPLKKQIEDRIAKELEKEDLKPADIHKLSAAYAELHKSDYIQDMVKIFNNTCSPGFNNPTLGETLQLANSTSDS